MIDNFSGKTGKDRVLKAIYRVYEFVVGNSDSSEFPTMNFDQFVDWRKSLAKGVSKQPGDLLDVQIRSEEEKNLQNVHYLYWTLSVNLDQASDSQALNFAEFVTIWNKLSVEEKNSFIVEMQSRYELLLDAATDEGMKIAEEFLKPNGPSTSQD